jgi:hypothetical protein
MHLENSVAHRPLTIRSRLVRLVVAAGMAALMPSLGAGTTASAATTVRTPSPSAGTPNGSAAKTPAATPPPEVTWGIGPASVGGASKRPYFSFGVTPGAQASDRVAVLNYSLTPLSLNIYAVLADNSVDTGAIGFVGQTEAPSDVVTWLTVGSSRPQLVTVPGRPNASSPPGQVILPVKLLVPLNAQPGDHVGGIVAALTASAPKDSNGEHINLEQRVVTRVYVRVSGALQPKLQISNLHASYHEKGLTLGAGSVLVSYTVRNTGNVRVVASQVVRVSGLLGGSKKAVPASIAQLLPGGSARVSVVIHGVWPTVLVHPRVTVTPSAFPGDVDPPLAKLSASTWTWAVPWLLLGIVVLVLSLLWWRYRRNRQLRAPLPLTRAVSLPVNAGRHRVEVVQQTRSRHAR